MTLLQHPLLALLLGGLLLGGTPARAEDNKPDFSAAERLLLMSDQLHGLTPATTLQYRYSHRGSLDEPFDDQVRLLLSKRPDGGCCAARGEFLSGARKLTLPEVDDAQGNPVVLYFLERDIRELNRLTKGSVSYFRKRLRMALYEGATVRDLQLRYRGKAVAGREILLQPFVNDPNEARFPQHTARRYRFVLSDAVPGRVVALHSLSPGAGANAAPLAEDQLLLEGAELPASTVAAAPTPVPLRTAQR